MDKKLQKLLTLVNALPEQRIAGRDYEPVIGTLTAFDGVKHVESFEFKCDMADYQQLVTDYYYNCIARGLKASYAHVRIAII
jgi:hypothetical protein